MTRLMRLVLMVTHNAHVRRPISKSSYTGFRRGHRNDEKAMASTSIVTQKVKKIYNDLNF